MDITNAIRSSKRFKRKCWTCSMWLEYLDDTPSTDFLEQVSRADMLADDWEIELPSVLITRQQFDDAWVKSLVQVQTHPVNLPDLRDLVAKEIGL